MVRRRAEKLPRYPDLLMVIPGFAFQPIEHPEAPLEEFSITRGVKREYLEELFNMEGKTPKGNDISAVPEGKYLEDLLRKGDAQILFTGIATPLRDLWPEICTLLLITNPEWGEKVKGKDGHRPITMNWEYGNVSYGGKGSMPLDVPITETIGTWTNFVDPCSAALIQGIAVAKELVHLRR